MHPLTLRDIFSLWLLSHIYLSAYTCIYIYSHTYISALGLSISAKLHRNEPDNLSDLV